MENQLYSEICLMCIVLLGIITYQSRPSRDNRTQQLQFRRLLLSAIALFSLDWLSYALEHNIIAHRTTTAIWIINSLYFILSGIVCLFWVAYSESVQKSPFRKRHLYRLLCALPVFVLSVLSVSAYWNHFLFYIDDAGNYHRGPLYFFQLLCSFLPALCSAVKAYILAVRAKNYFARRDLLSVAFLPIIPMITLGLQMLFTESASLTIGLTIAGVLIFIQTEESQIFTDPLTGLNNRGRLDVHLSNAVDNYRPGKNALFLIMIDVDNFKHINDTYGHPEGDRALQAVADALKQSCGKTNAFISRYGGDEFTVVLEAPTRQDAELLSANISLAVSLLKTPHPYHLLVSTGIAQFEPGMTKEAFLAAADQNLYINKRHTRF